MMQNINQQVWKIIQQDVAIQKDLWRKIINTRALAKYLIQKYNLSASLDSVISAIRRFQSQEVFTESETHLTNFFAEAVVSTRNNVACITVNVPPREIVKRQEKLHGTVRFRITTGNQKVKIIVENPDRDKIKTLFKKNEILSVQTDLSEVSVTLEEKVIATKGILARIASELSLANINIEEFIIIPPEFLVYVKQADIVKAHDSILKLGKGE